VAKKLYYKIGEACKTLDIQPYVLRYWETEFRALSPSKSKSGQRVYSEGDLRVIQRIKELLYEEGYTIAGAKKKLEREDLGTAVEVETEPEAESKEAAEVPEEPPAETPPAPPAEAAPEPAPKKKAPAKKRAPARSKDDDRVAQLEKGVQRALKEARDILEFLDSTGGSR
jgi:DNA-binding transcriptional MerR regulator